LDALISRGFQHPDGAVLKIGCTLIDSGGVTDAKAYSHTVYRFVKKRQGRMIFSCKGSSEPGAPVVKPSMQKSGINLMMVGTDACKSTVYERIKLTEHGPGYMHYPIGRGYENEYFEQLVAERVMVDKFKKRRWIKTRSRNEALDIRAYNIAAFEVRNVNLEAVSETVRKQSEAANPKPPTAEEVKAKSLEASHSGMKPDTKPTSPAPRPTRRRMGFVRW
jgi:phage terminase large subunit GpA-like protein